MNFIDQTDYVTKVDKCIKPGLHIIGTIAERFSEYVSKRVLMLFKGSIAVISFEKIPTWNHNNCMETKPYLNRLKNVFENMCLGSVRLIWRPGFFMVNDQMRPWRPTTCHST